MKHRSFFTPLLVGNLLLFGSVFAVGFIGTLRNVDQRTGQLTATFQSQLLDMVRQDIEEAWPEVEERINQYCHSYSLRSEFRLTVINRQGRVLGDSEYPAEKMEPHNTLDRLEIINALAGRQGESVRVSDTKHVKYRYFAEPVWYNNEVVAAVRVAVSSRTNKTACLSGFTRRIRQKPVTVAFAAPAWGWPSSKCRRAAQRYGDADQSFRLRHKHDRLHPGRFRRMTELSFRRKILSPRYWKPSIPITVC